MQFERGMQGPATARHVARIADALQLLADGLAVHVLARQAILKREHSGKHARGHHRRCKTRAFLVGPDHHLDRMLSLDAVIVQTANHFKAAQHTVYAVETAAGRLRIRMRASHHRQRVRVAPRTAHEDVAHLVDRHRATRLLSPTHDQVTPFLVEISQREAANTALRGCADLRHRHQAVPQTLAVDLDRRIGFSVL